MVIWINGAFGAGKTTVAKTLARQCKGSLEFDPEQIGFMLRLAIPAECRTADFQDLPLWRELTVRTIAGLLTQCGRPLIVPMTLVNPGYFDEIMGGLRAAGIEVRHFALLASRKTLRMRLFKRWELPSSKIWAMAQADRCIAALASPRFAVHITTDGRTAREVAAEIRSCLPEMS